MSIDQGSLSAVVSRIASEDQDSLDRFAGLHQKRKEMVSPECKKSKLEAIDQEKWLEELDWIDLDDSAVSNLILGFFVKMEMKEVAKQFSKESGISLKDKLENKVNQKCIYIRKLMAKNLVEKVILEMKRISEKIFEGHETLLFELKSLKLLAHNRGEVDFEAIGDFSKVDFLEVYLSCKGEETKEKLMLKHEDLIGSIAFTGTIDVAA